ncbi:unnamed protein product [Gongylonema pulchrum]|uniref:Coiled-coil domain-containing protein 77 n=1 Tax=Gongylonema pulchrum TaxID=637853 RepID=A0A183DMA0_9BILA|nr:unnamed protein product [Gongylonema pulchrum]
MEKELRAMRHDLTAKEELTKMYEQQLKHLHKYKEDNDIQVCHLKDGAGASKTWHLECNTPKLELFFATVL